MSDLPDYQTCMLPSLRALATGEPLKRAAIVQRVADELNIPEEQRKLMLPSGKTPVIRSRIGWALTYLKQAALVRTTAWGVYQITERGKAVLGRGLERIDNGVLKEFPEFREFVDGRESAGTTRAPAHSAAVSDAAEASTPVEALENAHRSLRDALVLQLLDTLHAVPPARFEQIVVDVLSAMGYGGDHLDAARTVGGTGDGGIDGVIEEDRLGLDTVYVQAKRWSGTVGRPVVQAFAGALQGQRATKGVLITTSEFTADARDYMQKISARIVLIDGKRLAELMVDHGVGVSVEATYTVKKLDSDYFEE